MTETRCSPATHSSGVCLLFRVVELHYNAVECTVLRFIFIVMRWCNKSPLPSSSGSNLFAMSVDIWPPSRRRRNLLEFQCFMNSRGVPRLSPWELGDKHLKQFVIAAPHYSARSLHV